MRPPAMTASAQPAPDVDARIVTSPSPPCCDCVVSSIWLPLDQRLICAFPAPDCARRADSTGRAGMNEIEFKDVDILGCRYGDSARSDLVALMPSPTPRCAGFISFPRLFLLI